METETPSGPDGSSGGPDGPDRVVLVADGGAEDRHDGVADELLHRTTVRLDRRTQHLVMRGECHPHPVGVGLPPTGRALDVGEQKRHNS